MERIGSLVPRDHLYRSLKGDKKVNLSKGWWNAKLGELGRKEREVVQRNVQTLVTKLIISACKVTKAHKKVIINANTMKRCLKMFLYNFKVQEEETKKEE